MSGYARLILSDAIFMGLHEKNLWKIFSPDREWQICQHAQKWNAENDPDPQPPLAIAETLRVDTENSTNHDGGPNQKQRQQDLAVELGGFQTKSVENFAHSVNWGDNGYFLAERETDGKEKVLQAISVSGTTIKHLQL